MIFITVGTHEQGMERLFKEIDILIDKKEINEEVFAQIGYSKYKPRNYKYKELIQYDEMDQYIKEARIVITHGGPGSIFQSLQYSKIPIVIPRDPKFNEHVDNHQILFVKRMENEKKVIGVYDIKNLDEKIINYNLLSKDYNINKSNNNDFIKKFSNLIDNKLNL